MCGLSTGTGPLFARECGTFWYFVNIFGSQPGRIYDTIVETETCTRRSVHTSGNPRPTLELETRLSLREQRTCRPFFPTVTCVLKRTCHAAAGFCHVFGVTLRPQEECEKFGSVKSVHIPRPSTTSEEEKPGVGFVFVAFDAVDSASKAAASLRARTFDGRKVLRSLFGIVGWVGLGAQVVAAMWVLVLWPMWRILWDVVGFVRGPFHR